MEIIVKNTIEGKMINWNIPENFKKLDEFFKGMNMEFLHGQFLVEDDSSDFNILFMAEAYPSRKVTGLTINRNDSIILTLNEDILYRILSTNSTSLLKKLVENELISFDSLPEDIKQSYTFSSQKAYQ